MSKKPVLIEAPRYFIELDARSIERAIATVAKEMDWPNEREGSAEFIVGAVLKALETPAHLRTTKIAYVDGEQA